MCLNACPLGSGTVKRCGLGIYVALLEEACPMGVGFKVSNTQTRPSAPSASC